MPRRRLGVALLPTPEIAHAIDALRAALGDERLGRIPPHVTLVPPVNVRADDFDTAIEVLRAAAKGTRPFAVQLGPPATFLPDTPVLYLAVGGAVDALVALRDAVFVPPLERALTWPFVPHCTLLDDASEVRIDAALVALADAHFDYHQTSVHLLEEQRNHVWTPIAEFAFRR